MTMDVMAALPKVTDNGVPSKGAINFIARHFVINPLPHKFTSSPGAEKSRLILIFITTYAVKFKTTHINLGKSLSDFTQKLGFQRKGKDIHAIETHLSSLLSLELTIEGAKIKIAETSIGYQPTLTLTQDFYKLITCRPIPINSQTIQHLKNSSLAMDIYCWLTYKMSYLKKSQEIGWTPLKEQFGKEYARERKFKEKFLCQLERVLAHYKANAHPYPKTLLLLPTNPDISK